MDNLAKKTVLYSSIVLVLYLLFFFLLDRPISLWINNHLQSTWIFDAGTFLSYLADGSFIRIAVALCFIVILVFDPTIKHHWTRMLLYVALSAAIALVVGEGLKIFLGRHRPVMLYEQEKYGLHFFTKQWEMNSTPSGHSLRIFSILTALSLLFRKWVVVFVTIAVLVCLSRVIVTAHYPSDIIFGAYIGIFSALWTFKNCCAVYPDLPQYDYKT
ncbi:MAG: phosphatase PAP2 family protein [Candidatus Cloacimonetes bacterium]|nr:phosphatase PAP2 family protein [Candidatus Cloacimonadota bacterium]